MKTYVLKLTSAIAIDGAIVRAGGLVELTEAEAKNLLARGKALLATVADGVEVESDDADSAEKPRKKKSKEAE